ncbi:hypothetical protein ACJX0J_040884 [Zea mays]
MFACRESNWALKHQYDPSKQLFFFCLIFFRFSIILNDDARLQFFDCYFKKLPLLVFMQRIALSVRASYMHLAVILSSLMFIIFSGFDCILKGKHSGFIVCPFDIVQNLEYFGVVLKDGGACHTTTKRI